MLYLTREDSLELLPLSARSSNCLRRAGIHTVGQLLDYPADKWLDIRNMGTKSVDEVLDLAARIRAGDGFQMVASKPKPPEPPPPRLPDIPVPELGLSVRANNCLESMGVRTAADLSDATLESLLSVKNMGRKTAEQIMKKLEELREQFSFPNAGGSALPEEPGGALRAMVKDLSAFTKLPQGDLLRYLAPCWEASPNAEEAELLDLAFQQGPVRREARRAILRLLEPYEEAVSPEELLKFLPAGTSIRTLKLLLGTCCAGNRLPYGITGSSAGGPRPWSLRNACPTSASGSCCWPGLAEQLWRKRANAPALPGSGFASWCKRPWPAAPGYTRTNTNTCLTIMIFLWMSSVWPSMSRRRRITT